MAPINQAQSCHWQESSSRTTSLWCRSTPSNVYLQHADMGTTKPPWHNYPSSSPAQHKQWEVSPYFKTEALVSLLKCCFTHMQRLYANLPWQACTERWVYPGWTLTTATLKGNNSVVNQLSECVVWFCFKLAIIPNSVLQVSDMVKAVL